MVIVFNLIKLAEAQGWVENLVRAAREANPENQRLKATVEEFLSKIIPGNENSKYSIYKKKQKYLLSTIENKENNFLSEILNTYNQLKENALETIKILPEGNEKTLVKEDYSKYEDSSKLWRRYL